VKAPEVCCLCIQGTADAADLGAKAVSVIPLTIIGPDRSVVQKQAEFEVDGRRLLLTGLQEEQFSEEGASNVSYDLRVGSQYKDHREQLVKELPPKGVVTLRPGSAIIVQTEEFLHLPRCMYGSIAPKVSLLQQGLSTTYSKVDPGYNGHLLVTLFNLGKTTVDLERGKRFCALSVLEVAPGARLYDKGSKQINAPPAKAPRRGVREFLEQYHLVATVVTAVVAMLLAIAKLISWLESLHHAAGVHR
jgi:dCTP deaminase